MQRLNFDEFKQAIMSQFEKGKTFFQLRDCSICGYNCGYVLHKSVDTGEVFVGYDTGCDCTYNAGGIKRSIWIKNSTSSFIKITKFGVQNPLNVSLSFGRIMMYGRNSF